MAREGHYHNKGQHDATNGDYAPPHGMTRLPSSGSTAMQDHIEENQAYDIGYFYARGQLDQADNDYSPPDGENRRGAYDTGWESAKKS